MVYHLDVTALIVGFNPSPLDIITDLWSTLLSVKSYNAGFQYCTRILYRATTLRHMITMSSFGFDYCDVHQDPLLL